MYNYTCTLLIFNFSYITWCSVIFGNYLIFFCLFSCSLHNYITNFHSLNVHIFLWFFSYFCDITFNFSYFWKVFFLFSWRQMVSQGFIFYVSKIPVIISTHSNDGVKKKIFNYNYRNWLSGTFSSHLKDKKFKWVNKSYGVIWTRKNKFFVKIIILFFVINYCNACF